MTEKPITDHVDELYHVLPGDMDSIMRARVCLAAADAALDATQREYGTRRRAALLAIQRDIAECVSRLNDLPADEPDE